jgi:tetratricopeptide (TPR) repeat protein
MTSAAAESQYQRGNALRNAGRFAEAEDALRDALRLAPAHREASYSLAFLLREQGRTNGAAATIAAWTQHARPTRDEVLAALGFLLESDAHAPAHALARDARERWPDDARIAERLSEIALALGEFDAAAAASRDALDRDPALSAPWLRLAHCKRFARSDDADLQRFEQGWLRRDLAPLAHVGAGFALGKALDDLGDHARAAAVLRNANAAARAQIPWQRAAWRSDIAAQLSVEPLPQVSPRSDFIPVFVVGMPRSGTTLVANTLGGFDGVRDRGELNWIGALHAHLREQNQLHSLAALAQIAALVCAQMRRDDAPARCYVDKNPLNFRYLDFIVALFPNARIVHCRRGLRDTALSLWMQHFAGADMGFSHDFADIAAVAGDCNELMAHWQKRGVEILDLDYESFVAAPDAQRARLAQFVGVEMNATVAASAESAEAQAVRTASVWQVRQPLHLRSIGRWRDYAPYLPELETLFAS